MIKTERQKQSARRLLSHIIVLFCMILFIYCLGATVAPLQRLVSTPLLSWLPTNGFLIAWGAWLPVDLHLASNVQPSQTSTAHLEFFLLIVVAFVLYGIAALVIRYQLKEAKNRGIYALMWIVVILIGLIFVFTPAMLSHDIFVYADYGHTIVAHGGNPYFMPPGVVSRDVLTQLDDWRMYIAAYGPLWLDICSFLAWLLGSVPWHYILGFRLLALAAHLLNIVLVTVILRKAGCTKRTILLGTWLYAMNPLVLLESSLGAHNDIVMATFLLLGVLLCFRAEHKGFTRPIYFLPPVVTFTLSALIKFTTIPLIILFLVLLARKTLRSTGTDKLQQTTALHWRSVCIHILLAGVTCSLIILAFYAPYWQGHTFKEIVHSFSLPPSAVYSENSLSRVVHDWVRKHGLPAQTSWTYLPLYLFNKYIIWNRLSVIVLSCTMIIGAIFLWYMSSTQTLVLAALASLGALLIVTPWFYSWYIIWLIALAGASFSLPNNRMRLALVGFALMFSFTAFLTYISNTIALLGEWAPPVQTAVILGLPVLVFLVLVNVRKSRWAL